MRRKQLALLLAFAACAEVRSERALREAESCESRCCCEVRRQEDRQRLSFPPAAPELAANQNTFLDENGWLCERALRDDGSTIDVCISPSLPVSGPK